MAENDQDSQGLDASTPADASGDKQSMLLRLAERTVVPVSYTHLTLPTKA